MKKDRDIQHSTSSRQPVDTTYDVFLVFIIFLWDWASFMTSYKMNESKIALKFCCFAFSICKSHQITMRMMRLAKVQGLTLRVD